MGPGKICIWCGDEFKPETPNNPDEKLCMDCWETKEDSQNNPEPDYYSDADSGL